MDLFKTFKTDKAKEQDGVWVQVGEKARLKIARMNNPRYRQAILRRSDRYRMAAKVKNIPEDALHDIALEVMAETILLDWEDMTWNGEPFPYTVENAKKALALEDFRTVVSEFAESMDNFKEELDQGTEKNSARP